MECVVREQSEMERDFTWISQLQLRASTFTARNKRSSWAAQAIRF
jgi:hypothetical protein